MSVIGSISSLYEEDVTSSDCLLLAARWCGHKWGVLSESFGNCDILTLQGVKKIITAVGLIFTSIIAYPIAGIGILVKAIEIRFIREYDQFFGEENQDRLWGATNFEGQINRPTENVPLSTQKEVYRTLKKKGLAGSINDFFDYLPRLMPGGSVAFQKIPVFYPYDATKLQPSDMSGPLCRGKDLMNRWFLAMHVRDAAIAQHSSTVLVFTHPAGTFHVDSLWKQVANAYWSENQLQPANKNILNYILGIICREDLTQRSDITHPALEGKMRVQLVAD